MRPRPQGLQMSKESGSQRLAPEEEKSTGRQQLWGGKARAYPCTWGLRAPSAIPTWARDGVRPGRPLRVQATGLPCPPRGLPLLSGGAAPPRPSIGSVWAGS